MMVLFQHKNDKYYMVAGHTGEAVYKRDGPYNVYINVNSIPDMNSILKVSTLFTYFYQFVSELPTPTPMLACLHNFNICTVYVYLTPSVKRTFFLMILDVHCL